MPQCSNVDYKRVLKILVDEKKLKKDFQGEKDDLNGEMAVRNEHEELV